MAIAADVEVGVEGEVRGGAAALGRTGRPAGAGWRGAFVGSWRDGRGGPRVGCVPLPDPGRGGRVGVRGAAAGADQTGRRRTKAGRAGRSGAAAGAGGAGRADPPRGPGVGSVV